MATVDGNTIDTRYKNYISEEDYQDIWRDAWNKVAGEFDYPNGYTASWDYNSITIFEDDTEEEHADVTEVQIAALEEQLASEFETKIFEMCEYYLHNKAE